MDNPIGLEQIDKAKTLNAIEEDQNLNEIIANIPTEFVVDGKTLKVDCRTIKQMVVIDRAIIEAQKLAFSPMQADADSPEWWVEIQQKIEQNYEIMAKIIFLIVNKNSDEPEIELDWVKEHIDVTENGIGEKILDSYNYRNSPSPFLKKILGSRKF